MDESKPFEEVLSPDPRQLSTVIHNSATGETRVRDLREHHHGIASVTLSQHVPEDVQNQFTTANHLLLYSWFAYRFVVVAELQAYSTLEYALASRLGHMNDPKPPTLGPLLRKAIARKLVRDEAFLPLRTRPRVPVITGNAIFDANLVHRANWDPKAPQLQLLAQMLPELRNMLAHGSTNLWPGGVGTLLVVATFLSELYPASAK